SDVCAPASYTSLAQLYSNRLLTDRSQVRTLPVEPYGGVAQLARAFGSYPKGRGVDPLRRYFFLDPYLSWLELSAHNRSVAGSNPAGSIVYMEEYPSLVEGVGLENRKGCQSPRGFESLFLLFI